MDELEVEEVLRLIPEDVIFNIFSRIPLKSLFRLRSVSKQWCKLIDHPCLAPMHMLRREDPIPIILYKHDVTLRLHMLHRHNNIVTKIRPAGRTSSSSSSSYTLQASHVPFVEYFFDLNRSSSLDQPFGSCNGLVYFTEQGSPSRCSSSSSDGGAAIIVSNPLRRISLKLSSVHQNFAAAATSCSRKTYGLGFDSSNNSFKMVCVFSTNKTLVQTLGTNTWREISQVPPCPISGTPVYTSRSGFNLHWKIDPCFVDHENIESVIVSFDVRKEEFKFTPHPYFHSKDPSLFQLLELNGNLAMVDLTFWEIWVLKDYDRKYWVKECCIPIAAPGLVQIMGLSKDGEVLIKSNGGFFLYGPKTDLHYVQISCPYPDPSIYCFTGSLFSISNLMAENE